MLSTYLTVGLQSDKELYKHRLLCSIDSIPNYQINQKSYRIGGMCVCWEWGR